MQEHSPEQEPDRLRVVTRLDDWNSMVSEVFGNVLVDAPGDRFHAALGTRHIGALELSRVDATANTVHRVRLPSESGGPVRYFKLLIQDVGSSLNVQAGREAMLNHGDMMLTDTSRPYTIQFDDPNRMLVLRLPEDKVIERLEDADDVIGRRIGAEGLGASVLSAFVQTLWQAPEAEEQPDGDPAFLDVVLDLLAIAYRRPGQVRDANASALQERIKRFIDDHLCDPNLSVTGVARNLGVTPRYVQMVFASMGTTPLAYIRRKRLQLAAQRLRREGQDCSITALSFSLGFNDLSHFSRTFKSHFGVGPREYRAR